MTPIELVVGMVAATAAAAVWSERRRSRNLLAFQRWSRLGPIEIGRRIGRPDPMRVAFVAAAAVCCGFSAILPSTDPVSTDDDRPDLVIALDTSKSMYASDVRPSRIHEAVRQLHPVIRTAPIGRIAIVGFAGAAAVLCPLTDDRDAASEFLGQLEREPVGGRGSDLGLGLQRAADALASARGQRLVLFVSDGETTGSDLDVAIGRLRAVGLRVVTVGVGTPGGAPVPAQPRSADSRRDPNEDPQAARTSLDEKTLADIAGQTGGSYLRLRGGDDLSSMLAPVLNLTSRGTGDSHVRLLLARVVLGIGLAALAWDTARRVRRNRQSPFA